MTPSCIRFITSPKCSRLCMRIRPVATSMLCHCSCLSHNVTPLLVSGSGAGVGGGSDRCSYPQGFKHGDVQQTPLSHMAWQEPMQNCNFHHTLAPPNRPRPPCSPSAQEQRAQVRVILNDVLFKIPKASTKADSPHPHHGEIPQFSGH